MRVQCVLATQLTTRDALIHIGRSLLQRQLDDLSVPAGRRLRQHALPALLRRLESKTREEVVEQLGLATEGCL